MTEDVGSDDGDSGNDKCDQAYNKGGDDDNANSFSSELVEVLGDGTQSNKENVGPENKVSETWRKGVGDKAKKSGPAKKRSRFGWLLRR